MTLVSSSLILKVSSAGDERNCGPYDSFVNLQLTLMSLRYIDYKERPYGNSGKVDYTPPSCEGEDCDEDGNSSKNDKDKDDFESNNSGTTMTSGLLAATAAALLCLVAW